MNEKRILKQILKDCPDGYGVFEIEELMQVVPKLNVVQIKSILKHLELTGFINIKYSDANSYCLAPLPKAKQIFEEKPIKKYWQFILMFLMSFFGAFFAVLIGKLI